MKIVGRAPNASTGVWEDLIDFTPAKSLWGSILSSTGFVIAAVGDDDGFVAGQVQYDEVAARTFEGQTITRTGVSNGVFTLRVGVKALTADGLTAGTTQLQSIVPLLRSLDWGEPGQPFSTVDILPSKGRWAIELTEDTETRARFARAHVRFFTLTVKCRPYPRSQEPIESSQVFGGSEELDDEVWESSDGSTGWAADYWVIDSTDAGVGSVSPSGLSNFRSIASDGTYLWLQTMVGDVLARYTLSSGAITLFASDKNRQIIDVVGGYIWTVLGAELYKIDTTTGAETTITLTSGIGSVMAIAGDNTYLWCARVNGTTVTFERVTRSTGAVSTPRSMTLSSGWIAGFAVDSTRLWVVTATGVGTASGTLTTINISTGATTVIASGFYNFTSSSEAYLRSAVTDGTDLWHIGSSTSSKRIRRISSSGTLSSFTTNLTLTSNELVSDGTYIWGLNGQSLVRVTKATMAVATIPTGASATLTRIANDGTSVFAAGSTGVVERVTISNPVYHGLSDDATHRYYPKVTGQSPRNAVYRLAQTTSPTSPAVSAVPFVDQANGTPRTIAALTLTDTVTPTTVPAWLRVNLTTTNAPADIAFTVNGASPVAVQQSGNDWTLYADLTGAITSVAVAAVSSLGQGTTVTMTVTEIAVTHVPPATSLNEVNLSLPQIGTEQGDTNFSLGTEEGFSGDVIVWTRPGTSTNGSPSMLAASGHFPNTGMGSDSAGSPITATTDATCMSGSRQSFPTTRAGAIELTIDAADLPRDTYTLLLSLAAGASLTSGTEYTVYAEIQQTHDGTPISSRRYSTSFVYAPPALQAQLQAASTVTVRAATTANITISTALNNGDTLDGVTLATGDLVLVKNQSTASQNGIYVVGTSPARWSAWDTQWEMQAYARVTVQAGTTNAGSEWVLTNTGTITVDSTNLTFVSANTYMGHTLANGSGVLSIGNATLPPVDTTATGALWPDVDDTDTLLTIALWASNSALRFDDLFVVTAEGLSVLSPPSGVDRLDYVAASPGNPTPDWYGAWGTWSDGVLEVESRRALTHEVKAYGNHTIRPGSQNTVFIGMTTTGASTHHFETKTWPRWTTHAGA